ncbi:MAG: RsmF rRNA methyltransferase first C-terminal domain-containing protein, partial [Clostridia bacterium]|nr:RsmF rRNA methyltransferase first C-terminal domain-containing protein [Clostridia bacterium]
EWESCGFYANGECIGKTVFHAAGLYFVQEPSAMSAVPKLEIKAGERILDLCAAPGGKTTQIAAYMGGNGVLVANEIDFKRYTVLKSNVERMGARNVAVTCQSPENLARFYKNYFDKILVDAPCSGEGMVKKEEAAVREWSLKNVQSCAARQAKILESAHGMLAGGGRMVYSTCTFSPEEDERQIENFLTLHPEYKLTEMKKLLPHRVRGEGHFYAILDKPEGERAEDFHQIFTEKQRKNELNLQDFGVNPTGFKNVVKLGESLYSLVDNFPAELKAGVKLGEYKNGRFEPSHALAMCLRPEEVTGVEVDEKTALYYLRGLTFDCAAPNGWRAVTFKGYPLGWCKVVNGTAKNHLPKGLRI